ncbi:S41 family peptidase [Hyphobacterium sp. HN65]|uniref:S41 family peptidase n=1 Tax=Hyphobacterium lacteum TaxID=3116575 RepID=A0ABU7LR11_9PROT|nr:S41 family peptidase [Hyphobacterium sp. HN65]MEE2526348.1 S41 family peptidase [Hyphobacterium sp. HN65]
MIRSITSLVLTSSLLFSAAACAQQPATETSITAPQLAADITDWREWLFATHPDPSFSMDVDAVNARFDAISASLSGDYSPREAWYALSVMNPLFNDGHVAIRTPNADYDAYLASGGADFVLPVDWTGGRLLVGAAIAPDSAFSAGDEILTINGLAAGDIAARIFARTHGDSDGLRRYLLETRFSAYLWGVTGGAREWTVTAMDSDGHQYSHQIEPARDHGESHADNWSLTFADSVAILSVNTFAPDLEETFNAFLEPAFAEIAERGASHLIIDISRNGGGAHMLSDALFAYITTQRYTPLSAVTARITPENQARIPGSEIGQVVSLPFAQWVEPPAELENRFNGETVILVGPGTYSQAIVMAATAQDFNIAPIAGPGTEGRANSTGQVQVHTLEHSGLEAAAPIYIFIRPNGDTSGAPVQPDIPLTGTREEQIDALIARMTNG